MGVGSMTLRTLNVTEIGEFIRHRSCERRFKLSDEQQHDPEAFGRSLPFFERLSSETMDPVLQEAGKKRENDWEETLVERGFCCLTEGTPEGLGWSDFCSALAPLVEGQQAYGREIGVGGPLGAFKLEGRIDFALLLWRQGQPVLRLVECKASRRDRTYHRVQVAAYRRLVADLLTERPLVVAGRAVTAVEICVARIEEATNESQDMLALEPLDPETLTILLAYLERMLATDGPLTRILGTELDELEFQLDDRCNDCFFAVHCFTESARERRLELLGLSPAETRALRACGVKNLDELAMLEDEETVLALRKVPGLALDPLTLSKKAETRLATLPGAPERAYEVERLRSGDLSLLPEHGAGAEALIRVYLAVDYDYSENRVGALSAHVTRSEFALATSFQEKGGKWAPDPEVKERRRLPQVEGERARYEARPVAPRTTKDVIEFIDRPWSGDFAKDCDLEHQMLTRFFKQLLDAIEQVSLLPQAPLHFYVWEKGEISSLIDACLRLDPDGSSVLAPLRSLLSSRGHSEQVIYSALAEEMSRRFAIGYTGSGPLVAASLRWFGDRYHWVRKIGPQTQDLSKLFGQDLFDFQAPLPVAADGDWAGDGKEKAETRVFEVRGRFKQSLTAPYWRAAWKTLKDPRQDPDVAPEDVNVHMAKAVRRYLDAAKPPGYLKAFLKARVQALRWLEEHMTPKNKGIEKPSLALAELRRFDLEVEGVAGAAIDFLRLDHHVQTSDWVAAHLAAPSGRVALGRSLPVKEVSAQGLRVEATLDPERFGRTLAELEALSSLGEGSFIRLSPAAEDPDRGQSISQLVSAGKTCVIESIDWESGHVVLDARYYPPSTYVLPSYIGGKDAGALFDFATLDESPSDFVAGTVEARLLAQAAHPVCSWLDPTQPTTPSQQPLPAARYQRLEQLAAVEFIKSGAETFALAPDQQEAALEGLKTRIQLLQGPPGTGKTQTTAAAVLLRVLARLEPGAVVCVAANTHTAVDTLLERLDALQDDFSEAAAALGLELPPLHLAKVNSRTPPKGRIEEVDAKTSRRFVNDRRQSGVVILGGTTNAILKLAGELDESPHFPDGFSCQTLVVDEASMLVFPHLLAITTLLAPEGELMLAGDHRQLSPIVAHNWEREDRAPVVTYTPFASAYDAIRSLADSGKLPPAAVSRSALHYTFRLPPEIRRLLHSLYSKDGISLGGRAETGARAPQDSLSSIWESGGIYLVVHDERASQQANEVEAALVSAVLNAAPELADGSVGVVTPHRAQRQLLKSRLSPYVGGAIDVIDTVERLQGGERETIFVSACASDPAAISARAEFLLDLNRANVAFSRPKQRLVVVVAESLLDYMPHELELYESSLLWKALRGLCKEPVCELEVLGHKARVFTASPQA
jgi:hypothetical protein